MSQGIPGWRQMARGGISLAQAKAAVTEAEAKVQGGAGQGAPVARSHAGRALPMVAQPVTRPRLVTS